MYYVYRMINFTKKEVYHGVSNNPIRRINKSHCVHGTKAIRHWNCVKDNITLRIVSKHLSQSAASSKAHALEISYRYRGKVKGKFNKIPTKGI